MREFAIFDSLDFIVYVSEVDTYNLIYINDFGRKLLGISKCLVDYGKCYRVLQQLEKPCSFCTNDKMSEVEHYGWCRHHPILQKYYMIKDHLIEVGEKKLRLECAMDISKIKNDERNLVTYIQQLSSGVKLEESISQVLQSILDYYQGARGYIFEFDWPNNVTHNTFEKCAKGVTAEMNNLQNLPLEVVQVWIDAFQNKAYIQIEDLESIKDDPARQKEYEVLDAQNIKSLITVPFYCNGILAGFLGVDDPTVNQEDIQFLLNLTYFISAEMEKRRMNERLKELSYCDQLTGINNRNCYYEFLSQSENDVLENTGVLFIDLNGLKHINDTYGHTQGDTAIRTAAEIIKRYFKAEEVFRISGDEFVVIMPNCTYNEFKNRIHFLEEELMIPNEEIASMGYLWEVQVCDLKQMINRAEQIMYVNKRKYYERNLRNESKHRPQLLQHLLKEIEKERFCIYMQPKAKLSNESIYGSEALVRRMDKEGRVVMPYEFITLLEREGLIAKIDFFVLREVCKCLKRWKLEGRRAIEVSVNISRVTLGEIGFVESVCKICHTYDIDFSQIQLEITESAEMIDENRLQEIILQLSTCGFGIALDDMGTKYSSLQLLSMTGIDTIKLDRSLICNIEHERKAETLVRHVIALCNDLGQSCIAEGVENEKQKEILIELGCQSIQGYWLDRPLPVEEFEKKYL